MKHEDLSKQVQQYIKENRHSLSDEDIKLLKRTLVALKSMEEKPHMDYVTYIQKTAQICDLVFRLFNDT